MALIGYARVSTQEQHLDPQLNALHDAGCAVNPNRPGFEDAMKALKGGDIFYCLENGSHFSFFTQCT